MRTAIVKEHLDFKMGQFLTAGTRVEVTKEDGHSCEVRRQGSTSPLYFQIKRNLLSYDKPFAVVLAWDTESSEGMGTILVGVNAQDDKEALAIAMAQAEDGSLYTKLYKDVDPEEIKVDEKNSFACLVSELSFIN
jgi:hypothetical protein